VCGNLSALDVDEEMVKRWLFSSIVHDLGDALKYAAKTVAKGVGKVVKTTGKAVGHLAGAAGHAIGAVVG